MNRTSVLGAATLVFGWAAVNLVASSQGQVEPPQVQTQHQTTRQEPPLFRSRITLVPLDVRVLGLDAKPVTDLTQADFTIFEESVPQQIAHFAAHGLVPETPPRVTRPALRRAPGDQLTPQRGRTFLIALGRGRIERPFDAVGAMIQFVRERLLPQDQVAVMAYNRATDFTTAHEQVVRVLERYRDRQERIEDLLKHHDGGLWYPFARCQACLPEFVLPRVNQIFMWPGAIVSRELPEGHAESHDLTVDRSRRLYEALVDAELARAREASLLVARPAIGRAEPIGSGSPSDFAARRIEATQDSDKLINGINLMRYLDGEKHLVFLSERGLSLIAAEEGEVILRAAADARVALHTIVTGGLSTQTEIDWVSGAVLRAGPTDWTPSILASAGLFPVMTMKRLAKGTGGVASVVRYPRDTAALIDEVTRFEYLLGYYPTRDPLDGKYRAIDVKVNRPGVTVLVRSGYYANDVVVPTDRAAFIAYRRVADVGAYRDNVRDLKLTLKASQAKSRDKKTPGDVTVDLRIDPSRIGFDRVDGRYRATLDVRVYCSDAREKVVGEVASTVGLNLTEDSYQRYLGAGVPYTARVAVTAPPRRVKVVAYDAASDLAGSTVQPLK